MCVSAEASFTLSAILAPVGIFCVKTASQRDRSLFAVSVVPLIFSVQQACEGLVWVGLEREDAALTRWAAVAYLFFALSFWLFWIPFSAVFLESRGKTKSLLGLIALVGLTGGLGFYLPILLNPALLVIAVDSHSLRYDFTRSRGVEAISPLAWHLAYLAVIAGPLFVVAQKRRGLVAFAVALVISAAISHVYFWYAFASVWCFFAAVTSLILAYAFHQTPASIASLERRLDEPMPLALIAEGGEK